jgi:hypothetical protein
MKRSTLRDAVIMLALATAIVIAASTAAQF